MPRTTLPTPGPRQGYDHWPTVSRAVANLPERVFYDRWKVLNEEDPDVAKRALRMRFRYRLGEYGRYCFPKVCSRPFNPFHRDIFGREKIPYQLRTRNRSRAYAAPRGIAKTTLTKVDVTHDIVNALEAFVVVLSATHPDAKGWVGTLLSWFGNEASPLWSLYGPFDIKGNGEDGYVVTVREEHSTALLSKSWGSSIRGANVNTVRPTRVVIDDGENAHRVDNPTIRDDWQVFLNTDVAFLPDREQGAYFDFIGTVLHPDSILSRILFARKNNRGWRARKYKAVEAWPKNSKLWEQCREIYVDLEIGDEEAREEAARSFYDANREEMDRGVKLLDPVALPIFAVYVHIWSKGMSAALRDLQNEAGDPARRIFDTEKFKRCSFDGDTITTSKGREIRLKDCQVGVHLDPIPAEKFGSDYAALAVVARDKFGYRFVLKVTLLRGSPSLQRDLMWSAFDIFGSRAVYTYEDNGFASLNDEGFERQRDDRREEGLKWNLDPEGVTSTMNKVRRVSRLEPDIKNGWIEFADDIDFDVIGQFRDFPTGANDDGPDAVERADYATESMPELKRSGWG